MGAPRVSSAQTPWVTRVSVLIPIAVLGSRPLRPRGVTKLVVVDLQLEPIRASEPSAIGSTTATAASSVFVRIDVPVEGVEVHAMEGEVDQAADRHAEDVCIFPSCLAVPEHGHPRVVLVRFYVWLVAMVEVSVAIVVSVDRWQRRAATPGKMNVAVGAETRLGGELAVSHVPQVGQVARVGHADVRQITRLDASLMYGHDGSKWNDGGPWATGLVHG